MRARNWRWWIGSALILAGATALGWCAWIWHEGSLAQKQAREWLARPPAIHAPAPQATAPHAAPPPIHRGDVIAELLIPRLRLSVMVFEGDDAGILKLGAGHIPGTGLPSRGGNIAIAAHRDTFFRPLRLIRPSDVISLKTPTGTTRFAVHDVEIVSPSDVQVLTPATGRDLTLVTCYPFYYIGSAPQRFIVHASLIPA
jgi:sortase A